MDGGRGTITSCAGARPQQQRADVLEQISAGIAARREELARTMTLEAQRPIRTARMEVEQAGVHLQASG